MTLEESIVSITKEMLCKKPSKQFEALKSEFNTCPQCHLYTCCCCWFLDDNPALDVGSSLFQHHHHYHLPPHPHPAQHSNVHHCHPMSIQTEQSHWTQDLASTLPSEDLPLGCDVGGEAYYSRSVEDGRISLPVRNETNV